MGSQLSSAMRLTTAICLILIGAILTLVEAKPRASAKESVASSRKICFEKGEAGCKDNNDCCFDNYYGEPLVCIMIGTIGKDIGKCHHIIFMSSIFYISLTVC